MLPSLPGPANFSGFVTVDDIEVHKMEPIPFGVPSALPHPFPMNASDTFVAFNLCRWLIPHMA